jgi:hypothetical protein
MQFTVLIHDIKQAESRTIILAWVTRTKYRTKYSTAEAFTIQFETR